MKNLYVLLLCIICNFKAIAQTHQMSVNGYIREIAGGMIAEGDNNSARFQYIIYLLAPQHMKPAVTHIYIRGEAYRAQLQKIKTPVIFLLANDNGQQQAFTLVPATSKKAFELVLTKDDLSLPVAQSVKLLVSKNEVVVQGVVAAGSFIISLPKMKPLPMLLAQ